MWWWQSTRPANVENHERKRSIIEQQLLQQFRSNVSEILTTAHTDVRILKYLRAANYDLRKCEILFKEHLSMRAIYDIDKIVDFYKKPEVLEKYEFTAPLGNAKDGTPLTYVAMGRADFYGCISSVNGFDLCKYASLLLELDLKRTREQTKMTGKEINEITYIIDMDEFSLRAQARQSVIEMAFDMFRMLQDYYPEIWKETLIVNAPPLFDKVFNLFKPIMRGNLLKNIHMASKEVSPGLLLKYVDEDVLPMFLGGKRVDSKGDPMCREFLKFGGQVPEKHYAVKRPLLDPTEPGMETFLIRSRSCHNKSVAVKEADSRLRIHIRSEGGSIACTILFREFGSDSHSLDFPPSDVYLNESDESCNVRLVSPCVKLQLHLAQAEDIYCHAPWPGIYVFRLDNTGNWINARKVVLRMEVIAPKS